MPDIEIQCNVYNVITMSARGHKRAEGFFLKKNGKSTFGQLSNLRNRSKRCVNLTKSSNLKISWISLNSSKILTAIQSLKVSQRRKISRLIYERHQHKSLKSATKSVRMDCIRLVVGYSSYLCWWILEGRHLLNPLSESFTKTNLNFLLKYVVICCVVKYAKYGQ